MYRFTARLMVILSLGLFAVLAVFPALYQDTYGVTANPASDFITRRASPMFLGLAVMFWMAADLAPGPGRRALCTGTAIMFIGIAFTGLYEYGRGFANGAIAIAAVGEMALAALLLLSARARH